MAVQPEPQRFSCDCGQVTGHISAKAVKASNRVVCYCKDCRAAAIHLGQPDPAPGPVDLVQTSPDGIHFESGKEHLALFRFSPNGLMRWYASCCNTPMFNTVPNPKIPFVGVLSDTVDDKDKLGKVKTQVYIPKPDGGYTSKGTLTMLIAVTSRILSSRLSGAWKTNPFYDMTTFKPVVDPQVLTKEQRAAANK